MMSMADMELDGCPDPARVVMVRMSRRSRRAIPTRCSTSCAAGAAEAPEGAGAVVVDIAPLPPASIPAPGPLACSGAAPKSAQTVDVRAARPLTTDAVGRSGHHEGAD